MKKFRAIGAAAIIIAATVLSLPADAGTKEAVRSAILRMKAGLPQEELLSITPARVAELLSEEESSVLGSEHLSFGLTAPAMIYVAIDPELEEDMFWLRERGFERADMPLQVDEEPRQVWRKPFPAGRAGLGVNSLRRRGDHYFAFIAPAECGDSVGVYGIEPTSHTLTRACVGAEVLADDQGSQITQLPEALEGHVLLRGVSGRKMDAHIAGEGSSRFFRTSAFAPGPQPAAIAATLTADPAHAFNVRWHTDASIAEGQVRWRRKGSSPDEAETTMAKTAAIEDLGLLNAPTIHLHTATLTGLEPATTYVYTVGYEGAWSAPAEVSTAPVEASEFRFLYMGDIQNGYAEWAPLRERAWKAAPDAAFCLTAGDQVNRGMFRDHWDELFHYADGFFADVPIVPAVGNHEMYQDAPELYLQLFELPMNGPAGLTPERAYAFEYGQVLVCVLDTNLPPETQAPWLDQTLRESDAVWKLAMFHHPVYSAAEGRDNAAVRDAFQPILDKYDVDVVFQGHDHAYMRTHSMRGGEQVFPGDGPVYVVASCGSKFYEAAPAASAALCLQDTATYQVIDVKTSPHRFIYHAYDANGAIVDAFTLRK